VERVQNGCLPPMAARDLIEHCEMYATSVPIFCSAAAVPWSNGKHTCLLYGGPGIDPAHPHV
jgi:hypothetical protein